MSGCVALFSTVKLSVVWLEFELSTMLSERCIIDSHDPEIAKCRVLALPAMWCLCACAFVFGVCHRALDFSVCEVTFFVKC